MPPADPAALARALTTLLTEEAVWNRYARAGLASARDHLGWDQAAARAGAAYRAVLGTRPGLPAA